jgi:phosphonopyruvate decarboxylase
MLSREDAIHQIMNAHGEDAIYITSTGYISRAAYNKYPERKNIFYMQGSMGIAPCIGLGIALNTDSDVVVISGDAALLMHLGITHTIRDAALSNLYVYVLDNGCHESVGGYKCSPLQNSYPGVHEVIKITKDGKEDRVGIDCIKNRDNIKELLNVV